MDKSILSNRRSFRKDDVHPSGSKGLLLLSAKLRSIKATTNETMGFVGRKEGIAALANALIYLPD